jgi:hypothetical protein
MKTFIQLRKLQIRCALASLSGGLLSEWARIATRGGLFPVGSWIIKNVSFSDWGSANVVNFLKFSNGRQIFCLKVAISRLPLL